MLNEGPPNKVLKPIVNRRLPPPPGTHAELMRRLCGTGLQIPYRTDDICKFIRIPGEKQVLDRRSTIYPTRRMFPRHQMDYDWVIRNTEIPSNHKHLIPKPSCNPKLQETYYKLYAKDKGTGCSWVSDYLKLREDQIRIYLWVFGISFRSHGSKTASANNPLNQLDSPSPSDASMLAVPVSSLIQGQAIHASSKLQPTGVTNIISTDDKPRMSSSNVPCSSKTSKTVPLLRKLTPTLRSKSPIPKPNTKQNDELQKVASTGKLNENSGVPSGTFSNVGSSASGFAIDRTSSSQKQKTLSASLQQLQSTFATALNKRPPKVNSVAPISSLHSYVTNCEPLPSNNVETLCNDGDLRDTGITKRIRQYSALSTWSFINEPNQSICSSVEVLPPSSVSSNLTSCSTSSFRCSCTSCDSSSCSGSCWRTASTSPSHVNNEPISSKDASTMTEPELTYINSWNRTPKSKDVATSTSDIHCSQNGLCSPVIDHETHPSEDAIIVPGTPEQEHSATLLHQNAILTDEDVIPASPE
jgi:hypothetical protein